MKWSVPLLVLAIYLAIALLVRPVPPGTRVPIACKTPSMTTCWGEAGDAPTMAMDRE
jgi:hypothetical protein